MGVVDPRLRYLLRRSAEAAPETADAMGVQPAAERVEVLVRSVGRESLEALQAAGMDIQFVTSGAYLVASGSASLESVPTLAQIPNVAEVEAARPMVMDLDISLVDTRTAVLHQDNPPRTGAGVVVGVIDGGIDYTHPNFRNADGTTRILFLWDQAATPAPGGSVPYGREYSRDELNQALADPDPTQRVPHVDQEGHGTHVAGIAAGNGRAGDIPFTGIAPEADLIIVAYRSEGITIGRSTRALAAFAYIVEKARSLGQPVVINFSQGMNGGGHAGETVLETGLDDLAREPGVILVKSAGNEQEWSIHAAGLVQHGQSVAIELEVQTNDRRDDLVEIWFSGEDQISVAVETPEGERLPPVAPGARRDFDTRVGNVVTVESDRNAADTGDTRVILIFSQGGSAFIQPGTWRIWLQGDVVRNGRYDAWIERTNRIIQGEQTRFAPGSVDPTSTISIPGTARRIITVGSYVTRPAAGAPAGQISAFSSRGPTRYGIQKPELAAPGERIISARSTQSFQSATPNDWHTAMPGTSMAAPHVAGAAALLLSVRPRLTCEQVKQVLMRSARATGLAFTAPDNTWGAGRMDVAGAVELAQTATFPAVRNVQVQGTRVSWATDIPTTGAVRYHTHQRQLALGKNLGSRSRLVFDTQHEIDLGELEPGDYYLEILAFSQDNWWTLEDNGGVLYIVRIPEPAAETATTAEPPIPHLLVDGRQVPVTL